VPAYYSISFCGLASLVDIPTYEGARPSKLFPALASAKPLLFIGKGEAARLVEHANAGLIVPPGDPQLIADAAAKLAQNPVLCAELGENGRRFVENNLQWSTLVANWLNKLTASRTARNSVRVKVSAASNS
jgi:glycosyltransferase involved in cell wall biosynthesis